MKTYTIISQSKRHGTVNVSAPFSDPTVALKKARSWCGHASDDIDWSIQEATLDKPVSEVSFGIDQFEKKLKRESGSIKRRVLK